MSVLLILGEIFNFAGRRGQLDPRYLHSGLVPEV